MSQQIKLVPLELKAIDRYEAAQLKHVQIYNTLLDNPEYEDAEILYMGEFVCVYTSDSCKERSAQISDLLFRESEKQTAFRTLKLQLLNRELSPSDMTIWRIVDMGYRQIVQDE